MTDLTSRDLDILETLTRRVRLLSADQVRRIWWPHQATCRTARRRLRLLVENGFIERRIVNVRSLSDAPEPKPLVTWRPGLPSPNPRLVSKAARNRWPEMASPTELYTATRSVANLFGSTAGGPPVRLHLDHDLLLADVYAVYRTTRPKEASRWLGEDAFPKAGYRIKDPDAFLIDDTGKPFRVIESAGRYTARQIEPFHDHCVSYDLPYELW